MAVLNFKGKSAVWNHHLSVPYHTLEKDEKISIKGDCEAENLIIEGDNLLALKSLLPNYQGQVKCIYIDPPYNTGNESWIYNDNVSNPLIKSWLGEVVGKDDLTKHDKWLCMMTPRLKLLWELLKEDGVLFISIDDNEVHRLRMLMDEIFGEECFVTSLHVQMSTVQGEKVKAAKEGNIVKNAEYVLVYSKNGKKNIGVKVLYDPSDYDNHYSLYLERQGKFYIQISLTTKLCEDDHLFNLLKDVGLATERNNKRVMTNNNLASAYKALPEVRNWIHENKENIFEDHNVDGVNTEEIAINIPNDKVVEYVHPSGKKYLLTKSGNNTIRQRISLDEKVKQANDFRNTYGITTMRGDWWGGFYLDMGNVAKEGGVEYENGKKPTRLIKQLIGFVSDSNDIILDSFAGSGTTAEAVIELNNEDDKNRKFILVQMTEATKEELDKNTCKDKTLVRVKNVINELQLKIGLTYYSLGSAIDADTILAGNLPTYNEFAKYVFYLATGKNHPDKDNIEEKDYFVGKNTTESIYLLYKKDLNLLKQLAITLKWAEELNKKDSGKKIVYAPACFLDEEYLEKFNIQFVSIPYNLFEKK